MAEEEQKIVKKPFKGVSAPVIVLTQLFRAGISQLASRYALLHVGGCDQRF